MGSPDAGMTHAGPPLLARVDAAARRARGFLVLRGGVVVAAATVAAAFATLGLDAWLRPGLPMRVGIGLLSLAALCAVAWRLVVVPGRMRLRPLDVAAVWDRTDARGGDRLVHAVCTLIGAP